MRYIRLTFLNIPPARMEPLIFFLSEAGADGFEEKENELEAWFPESKFSEQEILEISHSYQVEFRKETIPETNWNKTWEQNYPPVEIAGRCYIRAPFHPRRSGFEYELIIEPKMSFGTAHHETTVQMIKKMLDLSFTGKKVLDMGCGTGILAILAEKLGAAEILAVDNDDWAVGNSMDNIAKNNCSRISVKKGELEAVSGSFDIILANINRNVLLEQIPSYSRWLVHDGILLLSGFYTEDLDAIRKKAGSEEIDLLESGSDNNWVAALFEKQ